jgi:uncharacterized protein
LSPTNLTILQWVLAILGGFAVGLSKGGFVGVGIVSVLLFAEVYPARQSTGLLLPILVFADCLAVSMFRQHAHWKTITRLLPPALVGVVAGYFLMQIVPDRLFRAVIGWVVLAMAALQFARRSRPGLFQQLPHTAGAPG